MKYIIFLRGINVGGRNIKMSELSSCFEKAGFQNVLTVLQTGNVIVESNLRNAEKLRQQVELLLTGTFHYPAKVLIVTPLQLREIIQNYPFKNEDTDFHRYVIFTGAEAAKELNYTADNLDSTVEKMSMGKGVIYWRVRKGQTLDSSFGKQISKTGTKHVLTNRNLNTLEKILKKCE